MGQSDFVIQQSLVTDQNKISITFNSQNHIKPIYIHFKKKLKYISKATESLFFIPTLFW